MVAAISRNDTLQEIVIVLFVSSFSKHLDAEAFLVNDPALLVRLLVLAGVPIASDDTDIFRRSVCSSILGR
jgi:hypothetical protein